MNALERATGYLNIKPRTEMQVIKYLQGKGYCDDEISDAVKQLKEYSYIDDYSYAAMYFELGFEKGRGISRIRRELNEKGVAKAIIDDAFENLEYVPDQFETALYIGKGIIDNALGVDADEILRNMGYNEKNKLQAKVARRLASRGFSGDISYRVARKVTER